MRSVAIVSSTVVALILLNVNAAPRPQTTDTTAVSDGSAAVIEAQNIATDNAVASKAGAILSGDEILINSDKAAVIAAQSNTTGPVNAALIYSTQQKLLLDYEQEAMDQINLLQAEKISTDSQAADTSLSATQVANLTIASALDTAQIDVQSRLIAFHKAKQGLVSAEYQSSKVDDTTNATAGAESQSVIALAQLVVDETAVALDLANSSFIQQSIDFAPTAAIAASLQIEKDLLSAKETAEEAKVAFDTSGIRNSQLATKYEAVLAANNGTATAQTAAAVVALEQMRINAAEIELNAKKVFAAAEDQALAIKMDAPGSSFTAAQVAQANATNVEQIANLTSEIAQARSSVAGEIVDEENGMYSSVTAKLYAPWEWPYNLGPDTSEPDD